MTFQEQVKTELHEMMLLGILSRAKLMKAIAYVDSDPQLFDENSVMTVTDAAELAYHSV